MDGPQFPGETRRLCASPLLCDCHRQAGPVTGRKSCGSLRASARVVFIRNAAALRGWICQLLHTDPNGANLTGLWDGADCIAPSGLAALTGWFPWRCPDEYTDLGLRVAPGSKGQNSIARSVGPVYSQSKNAGWKSAIRCIPRNGRPIRGDRVLSGRKFLLFGIPGPSDRAIGSRAFGTSKMCILVRALPWAKVFRPLGAL